MPTHAAPEPVEDGVGMVKVPVTLVKRDPIMTAPAQLGLTSALALLDTATESMRTVFPFR